MFKGKKATLEITSPMPFWKEYVQKRMAIERERDRENVAKYSRKN